MSVILSPFLPEVWSKMLRDARRTGEDGYWNMYHGYRASVRVRDGWVILRLSHADTAMTDEEIQELCLAFGVPATAQRIPREGQGRHQFDALQVWHWVVYQWEDQDE